jgi:hypothetical protein
VIGRSQRLDLENHPEFLAALRPVASERATAGRQMLSALAFESQTSFNSFKRLEGHPTLYSARIGIHYRAIAHEEGDFMIWVWIGHHSEYDALLRRQ